MSKSLTTIIDCADGRACASAAMATVKLLSGETRLFLGIALNARGKVKSYSKVVDAILALLPANPGKTEP